MIWSETIDGIPIKERRRQERETNLFYKQLLENIMKKTAAKNSKRIRAKTAHLRGAAWHAARKGKQIEARWAVGAQGPQGPQGVQGPQGIQGSTGIQGDEGAQASPPTWLSLGDLTKAGLYVMKDVFNQMTVTRVHRVDRGVDVLAIVYMANCGGEVHSSIVGESQFQKIKE